MIADEVPVYLVNDVFVAGREPKLTYNPRVAKRLEEELEGYLSDTGKALTIDGATKSGKTTLVERRLPDGVGDAIWIHGQDIESLDDFWSRIVAALRISGEYTDASTTGTDAGDNHAVAVGVPKALSYTFTSSSGQATSSTRTIKTSEPIEEVARLGLQRLDKPRPVVIDDFHYVPDPVRLPLARAIKTLVRVTHVILIAVPYEAFDLVRREKEMQGRVWRLKVPPWDAEELARIPTEGFRLLNLQDPGGRVADALARWSYGSPFITQQLALDVVRYMGITETVRPPQEVLLPEERGELLRSSARRTEPPLFAQVLAGARTKGQERVQIELRDGSEVDIYGAVLRAVRELLPDSEMTDRQIKEKMDALTVSKVSGQRIGSALFQIDKIAEADRGGGDPSLRYQDGTLYVLDPFFAFYLAHGPWEPERE
jgi:hypothetical protein